MPAALSTRPTHSRTKDRARNGTGNHKSTSNGVPPVNGHGTDDTQTGSNRPVGRAEVMAAVLDAATELFADKGPDAVTVREVADRASVNHALIHRHYGTKQELLRVV